MWDELKTIPMSPETATVTASDEFDYNGESKEQLLMDTEGAYQKWLTHKSKNAWVNIEFNDNKVYTICGVGIKSANDYAQRDPTKVQISYWDMNEEKEVQIAEYPMDFKE